MLDFDPLFGAQERIGGLGGLGGIAPPEPSEKPAAAPQLPMLADDPKAALREGIAASARALGIDPVDLATAISYETAGTFDPTKRGPTTQWGQHRGLIQFGVPQAKQHGVDWNDPLNSQLGENGAVVSYLRSTGVKPGMGLLDIYSAINAGGVGLYNRTDANNGGAPGTVRDKVERQMSGHRAKAEALFGGGAAEPRPAMAFTEASQSGDVPPQFARSLGQSQVPVSPMAGRIAASLESPGSGAMPDEPTMTARGPGRAQVASLGTPPVPQSMPRASAAPTSRPMPAQGQPNMPMEDYTQGADRGALAFALMNAGMQPVGGGEPVGGLGGLGGFRPGQPSAQPAPGPPGPPQGQQGASQPQSIDAFLESRIPSVRPNPLAFFGKPALENQMAERERQTAIGMAKAMIAQGADPNVAASLVGTPEGRAQLVRMQERTENRAFQEKQFNAQQKNVEADNRRADQQAKSAPRRILEDLGITPDSPEYKPMYKKLAGLGDDASNQVAQRKRDAESLGLKPDDPRYTPYVLTGNMPKETQQNLTAGDKKVIYEAEDSKLGLDNTIATLKTARDLNRKTYTGATAGARAWLGTALPDAIVPDFAADPKKSADTREFGQIMSLEAIKSMSETLKGATTDREMARFMEILGDPSTPPDIRERTIDRMLTLAERQRELSIERAKSLREGDYFKKPGAKPEDGKPAPTVPGNTPTAAQPTRQQLEEEARRRGLLK
jgi:hypothetical protein